MGRVILAEPNHRFDLTAASKFGQIIFLSPSRLDKDDIVYNFEFLLNAMKKIEYDPSEDMVCLTGQIMTVSTLFAAVTHEYDEFKMLVFNSAMNTYSIRNFQKPRSVINRRYSTCRLTKND